MLPTRLFHLRGKNRAQALVEFSLTALLVVLLLTLIIEVARIFQAYVTLQSAAREAARYAVTGQWYPQYAGNNEPGDSDGMAARTSGWDPTSGNPLKHIPPCYPRFPPAGMVNGAAVGDPKSITQTAAQYYEPYRDARTCSIEEVAIRRLTGLTLDSFNTNFAFTAASRNWNMGSYMRPIADDPTGKIYLHTYEVVVTGYSNDKTPLALGSYVHADPSNPNVWTEDGYDEFYTDPSEDGGMVRGYGGDPGKRVTVAIRYRFGLITPILARMFPNGIVLNGSATMTNEGFGSTGVQSNAVLPPPLPPVDPPDDAVPPDFIVTEFDVDSPSGPVPPNFDVNLKVTVGNQGEATALFDSTLRLYALNIDKYPALTDLSFDGFQAALTGPNPPISIGSTTIPAFILAGGTDGPKIITVQFPEGGQWMVYAYADSYGPPPFREINERGDGLSTFDITREDNNIRALPAPVIVKSEADIEVKKSVTNFAPAEGEEFSYVITAINHGLANAVDVQIVDPLPSGLTYVSHTAAAGSTFTVPPSADPWRWTIPLLNNGASQTLTIKVKPSVGTTNQTIINTVTSVSMSPAIDDPIPGNNYPAPVSIVVGAVDMSMVSKTVNDTGPAPGAVVTFTLQAKNNSSATTAIGASITDTLPAGLTWEPNPSFPDCTHSGGVVTCLLPSIPPKGTATVKFQARVDINLPGASIVNEATVVGGTPDPNPDNNTVDVSLNIENADIEVTKTASVVNIAEANNFTYTITAKNLGPNSASSVKIDDVLPTGASGPLEYVARSSSAYDPSTGIWNVGSLSVNQTKTLTLTVKGKPGTGASPYTTVTNTASTSEVIPGDAVTANNTASVDVTITNEDAADLVMEKSVNPTLAGPNTNVVYTLKVTNAGPKNVTTSTVQDLDLKAKLDSGYLTLVSQSSSPSGSGSYNPATGIWSPGSINNGASKTLTLTVKVIGDSATSSVTNTATITGSNKYDQKPSNNSASATLNVEWPAAIFVNAGGSSCDTPVLWGAADPPMAPTDFTWVPSQTYTAGSWGIYGSSYTLENPPSNTTFIDGLNNPLGAPGQNLMGCVAQGGNFYYRFDNVLPGTYEVILVFADPDQDPLGRRFSVDIQSGRRRTRWLRNFDINREILNIPLNPPRDISVNPIQVHYLVKSTTFTVTTTSWLRLRFVRGRRTRTYRETRAIVSGIGIRFLNP